MIPPTVRIFVCPKPVDMRCGLDRLIQVARQQVGQDPVQGGALFVFAGRGATRLKLLWMEGRGVCLLYKRLHRAVFQLPVGEAGQVSLRIDGVALAHLLAGVPHEARSRLSKKVPESL